MAGKTDNATMARAIGRRKTAAARVRIQPGKGAITINGKDLKDFFGIPFWQQKVIAPLAAVGKENSMDVAVRVSGGGVNAQAEAIRHGVARALVAWEETLKPVLKAEGFLTRDPRARERKKYGLRRARRAHQWRKR